MTDARQDIEAAIKQHLIEICDELGEDALATPAVLGGKLYFRTKKHLICVGNKVN